MMKKEETTFEGHQAIEITSEKMKLVLVTDTGPRIGFFGKPDGKNLLFWDSKELGRNDWKLRGGHRVWAAKPGADESEDSYRPDNGACQLAEQDGWLYARGEVDPVTATRRSIGVKFEEDGRLQVDSVIANEGDMLYSTSAWALTCTLPAKDTRYAIPLGDGSEWDAFRQVMFRKWGGGHTSRLNDPQIQVNEEMMIIEPQGVETKRMIEVPYGIIAMDAPDRDTTFVKKGGYEKTASYPLGCNMAFYVGPDNFMVEMETMGPELSLKPGEAAHQVESWVLTEKAMGVKSAEKLLQLFK
jgi:hypothetical protein